MSDAATMLKMLAEPWRPGEFVKDVILRIAPLAGLSSTRASDVWYGKARRVEEGELSRIAAALAKKEKRAVWNELQDIRARMAKLESIVGGSDEDFGQPAAAVDRPRLRVAGGAHRAAGGR